MPLAAASTASFSRPKIVLSIPKDDLIHEEDRYGDKVYDYFDIKAMCYNSVRDELFYVDNVDYYILRSIHLHSDRRLELVNAFKGKSGVICVSYMHDSDTLLLVMEYKHLVVLTRNRLYRNEDKNEYEWQEADRLKIIDEDTSTPDYNNFYKEPICYVMNDSRVLFGRSQFTYMKLFCVESGSHIKFVNLFNVHEIYYNFSVSGSGHELVAVSYKDSMRVNRLCGDRLEEISRIQFSPSKLLWLADRLLVKEYQSSTKLNVVVELKVIGSRLERRRELLDLDYARINLHCWCPVGNELAIFDSNKQDLMLFSFA